MDHMKKISISFNIHDKIQLLVLFINDVEHYLFISNNNYGITDRNLSLKFFKNNDEKIMKYPNNIYEIFDENFEELLNIKIKDFQLMSKEELIQICHIEEYFI
jgi:hypothetical protein